MKKMSFHTKGTCSTGHAVESLSLENITEARKIIGWFSGNIEWISKRSQITFHTEKNTTKRILLGDFDLDSKEIRLFGYLGTTVGTLLHELAHFKSSGHGLDFVKAYNELTEMWDVFSSEIFPPEIPVSIDEVVEYLAENNEDSMTVSKLEIGEELMEEKINTNENVDLVISELRELGYTVR